MIKTGKRHLNLSKGRPCVVFQGLQGCCKKCPKARVKANENPKGCQKGFDGFPKGKAQWKSRGKPNPTLMFTNIYILSEKKKKFLLGLTNNDLFCSLETRPLLQECLLSTGFLNVDSLAC